MYFKVGQCLIGLIVLTFFLFGCATEYNLALRKEEYILISGEREVKMGESIARRLEEKFEVLEDDLVQQRIDHIGQKVAYVCDRKDIDYHFKVLANEEVNAVSLPGGYIYINKGLIDEVSTDDELAYVLGHEIGHVVAKHSVKRIQGVYGYSILRILVGTIKGAGEVARASDIAFGQIMLGYSRKDELDADRLGVRYAQRAGYDPAGAVNFLEKLKEIERKKPLKPPNYIRTHPPISSRIEAVRMESSSGISFEDYIDSLGAPY